MSVWTDDKHDAWYRLGSRMGDLVEILSGREDLIVRINPDLRPAEVRAAAPIPAAFFTPAKAETAFNASAVLREGIDDPDTIDPCDGRDQARHPELIGAAIHESAHAAHTRLYFPEGTSRAAAQWATLLEESRCEKRALERRPQDAAMLRISTHNLVAGGALHGDSAVEQSQMEQNAAVRASLLLLARVDNGVLEDSDVESLRERVVETLGNDVLDSLREVWLEAQNLRDDEREALITCGQRVQDILDDVQDNSAPEEQPNTQDSNEGEPGDSQDASEGSSSDVADGQPQPGGNSQGQGSSPSGDSDTDSGSQDQGEGQTTEQVEDSSDGADDDNSDSESGTGSDQDDSGDDSKSNKANQGGDRPDGEDNTADANGSQGNSGQEQPTEQGEAERDQNGSDGTGKSPADDAEAFRMPCGSWTEGNLPDDAEDAVDAPQGDLTDIEQAAREGLAEGAQEARRQVVAAAGIIVSAQDRRAQRAAERAEVAEAARAVFSPTGGTSSRRITIREVAPDATAQRMARQLGQAIKAAQFRDVTRTRVASQTPPGRLNIREAAARAAQVSRRENITATPWSQTRRRLVDNPPLTVGIAVDVSMSMDSWQRPVSTFAWSLSKAVRDLDGTVAVTAWNGTNTAIMHPGRGQRNMKIISCGGGSSGCPTALDALDGALNLSDAEGVRVAVVVTDGELPNMDEVQKKADRLKRHGVILLWVVTSWRGREVEGAVNIRLNGPDSFTNVVSQHITRALNTA